MTAATWYTRPVAAACVTLALLVASAYVLAGAESGQWHSGAISLFSVTIRHYGVDAREMERTVAIPLEDLLAAAPGALSTSSSSEYGKTRVVVRFVEGYGQEAARESVRDAAQRVYGTLPSSAQKPQIDSAADGNGPAWTAAVYSETHTESDLGIILERLVKPALEKLAEAGNVELAGTGIPEVVVMVDETAASVRGISVAAVAHGLSAEDLSVPAGCLRVHGLETPIVADGRYLSVNELKTARIPLSDASSMVLGELASVVQIDRKPEALARVDGKVAVTIAVYPAGTAHLPALSKAIAETTSALSKAHGIAFRVLVDSGASAARSFNATLFAMVEAALGVAVASALLVGNGRRDKGARGRTVWYARIVAVLAVPAILVVSAAVLSLLGFGFDRHLLAGLAAGLGASVDSAILAAERLGVSLSVDEGRAAMRELAPSLVSGTGTMLVVLIPLAGLEFLSEGVGRVAASIAAVSIVSLLASVIMMPPLILHGTTVSRSNTSLHGHGALPVVRFRKLARYARRALGLNAMLCFKWPAIPLLAALALGMAGIAAMALSPLDGGWAEEENTIYAHVEFEPGASVESVDARLAGHALSMAGIAGVASVQTTAKRGYGLELISFDPGTSSRKTVGDAARNIDIPGGYFWMPQASKGERNWEVVVSGDDDAECRKVAGNLAIAVSSLPFVIDTVLNFKDGPQDLVLRPDRELAATLGIGLDSAMLALRQGIHGPVAYKRLGLDGETDVRVLASDDGMPGIDDASTMLVAVENGLFRVDSFMKLDRERDASRIDRRDRRRVASITIRSQPIDPEEASRAVQAVLPGLMIPAGYSVEFDREAMEYSRNLGGIAWSFALAALLAYMVTAAMTESFGVPLAVLSALPPSLAVPAILLAVSGVAIDASVACAFVAVSGMAVNASVLTVDERRLRWPLGKAASMLDLYRLTRARSASLAATCGTSVLGALPFLMLSDSGNAMARSLAFVAATGTAASFFISITVVPALVSVVPGLFKTFLPGSTKESSIR